MTIRYDISAGYIGKNINDIDYTAVTSSGALSITHIITQTISGQTGTSHNYTIDLSSITSSDALIILTDSEIAAAAPGSITSVVSEGVTMNTVIKTDGTNCSVQGIFSLNGSDVTGSSSATITVNFSGTIGRSSLYVFRLINGANFQIADTDESYSVNASTQTNVVDFSNPAAVLFTNGYFPNATGHTFTAGTETEYNGVQNTNGSGDAAINETPTNSTHTITYTIGGATNTQGESLITAVLIPAGSANPQSQGLYSMNAVYNSYISDVYNTIVRPDGLDPIPVTDGLALHLDAADPNSYSGTGSTWFDISGNDRDFVWNSTPSFTSDTTKSYIDISGNWAVGPNADTYGINDTNGFTIITLMRLDNAQPDNYFMFFPKGTGDLDRAISLHVPWSNGIVYFDQGTSTFTSSQRINYTYTSGYANVWKVFAFRRQPTTTYRQIFEDNTVKASTTVTATNLDLTSLPTYINRNYRNNYPGNHSGKVNSLMVYNRGLTDAELTDVYNYLTDRLV